MNNLKFRPNGNANKRNIISGLFLLAKKQLISVISSVAKKEIFKVELSNYQQFQKYLAEISSRITKLNTSFTDISKQEIKFEDGRILDSLHNLTEAIDQLPKQFPESPKTILEIPKIQQISGIVKIANQKEFPLQSILSALQNLEVSIKSLKFEIPPQKEIKIPEFPNTISITESKALLKALKEVSDKLDELPKKFPEMDFPREIAVTNFPPQKYPMPVSNFNLNPLRGFAKSRNITVTTSITPLPDEVLVYRRSLIVFNNSTQTIYIGGSDVTSTNGLPVPKNTYSPPVDAGPKLIVYGIVASGTADVRVLELSNENIGS